MDRSQRENPNKVTWVDPKLFVLTYKGIIVIRHRKTMLQTTDQNKLSNKDDPMEKT